MLELRDYQISAVNEGLEYFLHGKVKDRPIIIAPTGSGKSLLCAKIAHTLEKGVLVIIPSVELLHQNYAKFVAYGGVASIYSASADSKEVGDVTFATIQSIKDKADLFSHVRYVINDENHLSPPNKSGMFTNFISKLDPSVKVLGLSATPFRLKTYASRYGDAYSQINLLPYEKPKFFNKIIHVTQIAELYEKGFLCPVRYVSLLWDKGLLKVNTTGAEYTDKSIKDALDIQKINQRLPDIIRQSIEKGRKSRLVFVHSVDDAEYLASTVPNSSFVSALTPKKERAQRVADFKAGIIKTMFNVGTMTVGFDYPALDTIIIARPTMSLALYLQMIGRSIRICEGKEYAVVVDCCGNVDRFGHLEEIEYKQDPNGKWYLASGDKVLSGIPIV